LAGGIGDVADGLAANGIISEEAAEKADQVAKAFMVVAGAADLLTTASALASAAQNAGGIAAARAAVASGVARTATLAQAAATRVATIAQAGFNAVFIANPLIGIVAVILAVVGALYLLYRNSETARRIIDGAFRGIVNVASSAFNGLAGIVDRVKTIGVNIVRGLIDGVTSGIRTLVQKVKDIGRLIPDSLRKLLGIRSPSRVLARIGRDAMRGLDLGLRAQLPQVERTLSTVAARITGLSASPRVSATPVISDAALSARTSGGNSYTIAVNVPPTADPAEVGRQVVTTIEAFERRTGRLRLAPA